MKSTVLVLSVLALAACSSEKKNVKPASAPVAAPVPDKSAEQAIDDGAKLAAQKDAPRDMFGAPEVKGLLIVHFDYDSAQLSEQGQNDLRSNAEFLRHNPAAKIVVEGHTDERGSDEYNLALGERRAKAVRDYLTLLGIDATRLQTVSYGAQQPTDMAHTEDAWSQNRRAQFRELD